MASSSCDDDLLRLARERVPHLNKLPEIKDISNTVEHYMRMVGGKIRGPARGRGPRWRVLTFDMCPALEGREVPCIWGQPWWDVSIEKRQDTIEVLKFGKCHVFEWRGYWFSPCEPKLCREVDIQCESTCESGCRAYEGRGGATMGTGSGNDPIIVFV